MKIYIVTYQMIGNFTRKMNLESEFQNRYILTDSYVKIWENGYF